MGGSLSPLALANKAESVVSVTSQCSFSSTIVHVGDKKPPESGMGSRVWARLRARARRQVPSQSPLPPSGPPRGEEAASVSDRGAASCFSPARRPMPLCPPSCFLCPLLSPSRGCYPHGPKDTACWKPRKGVGALTRKMSAGRAALQGGALLGLCRWTGLRTFLPWDGFARGGGPRASPRRGGGRAWPWGSVGAV